MVLWRECNRFRNSVVRVKEIAAQKIVPVKWPLLSSSSTSKIQFNCRNFQLSQFSGSRYLRRETNLDLSFFLVFPPPALSSLLMSPFFSFPYFFRLCLVLLYPWQTDSTQEERKKCPANKSLNNIYLALINPNYRTCISFLFSFG